MQHRMTQSFASRFRRHVPRAKAPLTTSRLAVISTCLARRNLTDAGLVSFVDFRIGDALKTLRENPPKDVDFVFFDGEKSLYLDVLKVLEPHLKFGAIIAADNTDLDGAGPHLAYVNDSKNGYMSSSTLTPGRQTRGHELSIRL